MAIVGSTPISPQHGARGHCSACQERMSSESEDARKPIDRPADGSHKSGSVPVVHPGRRSFTLSICAVCCQCCCRRLTKTVSCSPHFVNALPNPLIIAFPLRWMSSLPNERNGANRTTWVWQDRSWNCGVDQMFDLASTGLGGCTGAGGFLGLCTFSPELQDGRVANATADRSPDLRKRSPIELLGFAFL